MRLKKNLQRWNDFSNNSCDVLNPYFEIFNLETNLPVG